MFYDPHVLIKKCSVGTFYRIGTKVYEKLSKKEKAWAREHINLIFTIDYIKAPRVPLALRPSAWLLRGVVEQHKMDTKRLLDKVERLWHQLLADSASSTSRYVNPTRLANITRPDDACDLDFDLPEHLNGRPLGDDVSAADQADWLLNEGGHFTDLADPAADPAFPAGTLALPGSRSRAGSAAGQPRSPIFGDEPPAEPAEGHDGAALGFEFEEYDEADPTLQPGGSAAATRGGALGGAEEEAVAGDPSDGGLSAQQAAEFFTGAPPLIGLADQGEVDIAQLPDIPGPAEAAGAPPGDVAEGEGGGEGTSKAKPRRPMLIDLQIKLENKSSGATPAALLCDLDAPVEERLRGSRRGSTRSARRRAPRPPRGLAAKQGLAAEWLRPDLRHLPILRACPAVRELRNRRVQEALSLLSLSEQNAAQGEGGARQDAAEGVTPMDVTPTGPGTPPLPGGEGYGEEGAEAAGDVPMLPSPEDPRASQGGAAEQGAAFDPRRVSSLVGGLAPLASESGAGGEEGPAARLPSMSVGGSPPPSFAVDALGDAGMQDAAEGAPEPFGDDEFPYGQGFDRLQLDEGEDQPESASRSAELRAEIENELRAAAGGRVILNASLLLQLTNVKKRRDAALLLFNALSLASASRVDLEQADAYGAIILTRGPKFDA